VRAREWHRLPDPVEESLGASRVTGKAPPITRAVLDDAAGSAPLFDCHKAREHLGFAPRGAEEVVVDTLRWALFMGWLPQKLAASLSATLAPDPAWSAPRAA